MELKTQTEGFWVIISIYLGMPHFLWEDKVKSGLNGYEAHFLSLVLQLDLGREDE